MDRGFGGGQEAASPPLGWLATGRGKFSCLLVGALPSLNRRGRCCLSFYLGMAEPVTPLLLTSPQAASEKKSMKDTHDVMVTFLQLSDKEQESSSTPSCSQPAHMFTKELDTDCSPGTNTTVAGWGQWGKDPMSLVNTYAIFVKGGRMSFASQRWR